MGTGIGSRQQGLVVNDRGGAQPYRADSFSLSGGTAPADVVDDVQLCRHPPPPTPCLTNRNQPLIRRPRSSSGILDIYCTRYLMLRQGSGRFSRPRLGTIRDAVSRFVRTISIGANTAQPGPTTSIEGARVSVDCELEDLGKVGIAWGGREPPEKVSAISTNSTRGNL